MAKSPPRKKLAGKRLATRIHRWTGLASLAIVLVVALTGVLLNHTEGLKLNERRVKSGAILRHYGIEPAGEPTIFRSGAHLLAAWDGQVLFDDAIVDSVDPEEELRAAGKVLEGEYAFVFPSRVFVCNEAGELLDHLDEASLPEGNIRRAGAESGRLILEMESGEKWVLKDWVEFAPLAGAEPHWFEPPIRPSPEDREQFAAAFRGDGLPLSRILLDLHSGRLFGTIGVILYDIAAGLLVVLGITGVLLWLRRR